MLAREHITIYWAVANAIKETPMPTEPKTNLIKNVCARMKESQMPFDPDKFNQACWNEDEL
jgi:hypothetical protein